MSQSSQTHEIISSENINLIGRGSERTNSPRSVTNTDELPSANIFQSLMNNHFIQANQKINKQIDKVLRNESQINFAQKEHQCQKCDCSGTSECNKKIAFLQSKINQFMNISHKKEIQRLNNQSYLVQYVDNTLEKLSVKYIKMHYFSSYIQFLENTCFSQK